MEFLHARCDQLKAQQWLQNKHYRFAQMPFDNSQSLGIQVQYRD